MAAHPDVKDWLLGLSNRIVAVSDYRQRLALWIEGVTALAPEDAVCAVELILSRSMLRRDRKSLLVGETTMFALAHNAWPAQHRLKTYQVSCEMGHELSMLLLDASHLDSVSNDDGIPVPDYVKGRVLTLGERRSVASRPGRVFLEKAARDPHPMVIAKLLENPQITENDVVNMAAQRPASFEALQEIGRHPRWRCAKRVARALVLNPYTPPRIAVTLLLLLSSNELHDVAYDFKLSTLVRRVARDLCHIES